MSIADLLIEKVNASGLCDKVKAVELPELGENERVFVRTVRGDSFKAVLRAMSPASTMNDEGRSLALGTIALACDEKGNAIFTAKDHLPSLLKWPVSILNRIMKAGLELNGMSEEQQTETEKNSNATGSDTSN